MNRNAVAMAADSAVTIMSDTGHVIYKSVDKVFQLVESQSIGVMIYNNAEIMGTPWETIISMYRRHAAGKSFGTVQEYANDFVSFLNSGDLFSEEQQSLEYLRMVALLFGAIVRSFDAEYRSLRQNGQELPPAELFSDFVAHVHKLYQTDHEGGHRGQIAGFSADTGERMQRKHKSEIAQIINSLEPYVEQTYEGFRLDDRTKQRLFDMASFVVYQDAYFEGYTGLVFAGFGEREKFPSMVSLYTSNVIENKLKCSLDRQEALTSESGPAIHTFAQDRMVHTLIGGIDPELRYQIYNETLKLTRYLVADVVGSIKGLGETDRQKLIRSYSEDKLTIAIGSFFERIEDYQQRVHTQPILRAIDVLPKMELAETAASLVKLNSFQLRVSGQPETVGGPVDVAIISHTDGLIMVEDSHTYA